MSGKGLSVITKLILSCFLSLIVAVGSISYGLDNLLVREIKDYGNFVIPKLCSDAKDNSCQNLMKDNLSKDPKSFLQKLGKQMISRKGFNMPSDKMLASFPIILAPVSSLSKKSKLENGEQGEMVFSNPKYPHCRALAFRQFPYWKSHEELNEREKFALENVNKNEKLWFDILETNMQYMTNHPFQFCKNLYQKEGLSVN